MLPHLGYPERDPGQPMKWRLAPLCGAEVRADPRFKSGFDPDYVAGLPSGRKKWRAARRFVGAEKLLRGLLT